MVQVKPINVDISSHDLKKEATIRQPLGPASEVTGGVYIKYREILRDGQGIISYRMCTSLRAGSHYEPAPIVNIVADHRAGDLYRKSACDCSAISDK